jgi:hypothetical protein
MRVDLACRTMWPYPPLVLVSRAPRRPAGFANLAECISAILDHEAKLRHARDRNPPAGMLVPWRIPMPKADR